MRFLLPFLVLFGTGLLVPALLSATSIVPFSNLGEATAASESVVLARAVETLETDENGTIYLDTKFETLESTKGVLLPGTNFSLRPFSRRNGHYNLHITGDFKPETGKAYLLFLYQKEDVWRPVMLSYYVFEQFQDGSDKFLVPLGGDGLEVLTRPDGQPAEPLGVYKQSVLLDYLKAFAASPGMQWDGSMGRSILRKEDFAAGDRAIPTGCDFTLGGSNISRWQNASIPVYYDDTNNPGGWGGTFATVLSALNDNYTGINPSDGGSKSYVPNCVGGSAIDGNFPDFCDSDLNGPQSALIIFDDPCNEIANLVNCSGILAFGGSYSSTDTHLFDGLNWEDASYGFMVVNNGTPDCLNSTQFERMLTHELTHAYRMGHLSASSYPGQNMNPVCCNGINYKDRECMNYAYPAPAPVELISFDARISGARQVTLQWVTESEKDNAYFSVQRSSNGIQYEEIRQVPSSGNSYGGKYETTDIQPLSGINYYALSQTDFDGTVKHLGVKAVKVGIQATVLSISPNPVRSGSLVFRVEFPGSFDGALEVLDVDGNQLATRSISLEKGVHMLEQPLGDLSEGVYLLRLKDDKQQWTARFVKQ